MHPQMGNNIAAGRWTKPYALASSIFDGKLLALLDGGMSYEQLF